MQTPSERATRLVTALRSDAQATDHEGGFPVQSLRLLREAGLLAAVLPAELGGESLGSDTHLAELLATLTQVGRGNLVVGRIYEGHVNALQLLQRFGSRAQRQRFGADAAAGRLFGVWNTEAAGGVRLVGDPTAAAGSEGALQLQGAKTFASGCGHVDRALVTARRDDGGWQMVIVDTQAQPPHEDRRFWRPLGMRATASFRADLSGVRLDAADVLGEAGDIYREPAFSGGAVRFAAVQQGGIEAIFDEARRYLAAQDRCGDPHQRMRMGEMAVRVESGRLWIASAAQHARAAVSAEPVDADTAARTVAYAKLVRSAIEANGLAVMQLAERAVGARGLLQPEPFERLHRDLTHYLRQPAPDAAMVDAGAYVLDRSAPACALWVDPAGASRRGG